MKSGLALVGCGGRHRSHPDLGRRCPHPRGRVRRAVWQPGAARCGI